LSKRQERTYENGLFEIPHAHASAKAALQISRYDKMTAGMPDMRQSETRHPVWCGHSLEYGQAKENPADNPTPHLGN